MYGILADMVLAVHVSFALFVVLGFVVVWAGAVAGRRFVHGRWFRGTHLAAMGVVVAESLAGVVCPLTSAESRLRELAGRNPAYEQSFMHHWAQAVFYYDIPPHIFTAIYLAFFALMIITLWRVPVDWRGRNCRMNQGKLLK